MAWGDTKHIKHPCYACNAEDTCGRYWFSFGQMVCICWRCDSKDRLKERRAARTEESKRMAMRMADDPTYHRMAL